MLIVQKTLAHCSDSDNIYSSQRATRKTGSRKMNQAEYDEVELADEALRCLNTDDCPEQLDEYGANERVDLEVAAIHFAQGKADADDLADAARKYAEALAAHTSVTGRAYFNMRVKKSIYG